MAFQNQSSLDVVYDNKAYGNIIDPTQWNDNFKEIEDIVNENAVKIDANFDALESTTDGSSGADQIGATPVGSGTANTVQGVLEEIKSDMTNIVLGAIPDGTLTEAKIDSAFAAKLTGYENTFLDTYQQIDDLKINNLLVLLRLAANSSNIDAWCDLLTDTSLLKSTPVNTRNVKIDAGKLKFANQLLQKDTWASGTASASYAFGNSTYQKQRIPVSLTYACEISSIEIAVKLAGSPTDNVKVELTDSAMTTIYATFTIPYSSFNSSSYTKVATAITPVILNASTQYYIVVSRTGSLNGSNYYFLCGATGTSYGTSVGQYYNGSTWASSQSFYLITIVDPTGYAEWTAMTPTEVLPDVAICAIQTVGTGSITWYVSDDGTNWVEITSLNTMTATNFDATSIHLKCVLTGDAYVDSVAWGG